MSTNGQPTGSQMREIAFPFGGIDEYRGYAHGQPEMSQGGLPKTQSSLNMRGVDPRSGRMRGGSRHGTAKYVNSLVNGSNTIQDIAVITAMGADPVSGDSQSFVRNIGGSANGYKMLSEAGLPFYDVNTFATTKVPYWSVWNDDGSSDGNTYVIYRNSANGKWGVRKHVITSGDVATWETEFSAAAAGAIPYGLAAEQDGTYLYAFVPSNNANQAELWRFLLTDGTAVGGAAWKTRAAGQIEYGTASFLAQELGTGAGLLAVSGGVLALGQYTGGAYTTNCTIRLFNTSTGSQIANTTIDITGGLGYEHTIRPLGVVADESSNFYILIGNAYDISGPYLTYVAPAASWINRVSSSGTAAFAKAKSVNVSGIDYNDTFDRLCGPAIITNAGYIRLIDKTALTVSSSGTLNGETWTSCRNAPDGGFIVAKTASGGAEFCRTTGGGPTIWNTTLNDASHLFYSVNQIDTTEGVQLLRRENRKLAVAGGSVYQFTDLAVTSVSGGSGVFNGGSVPIFSAQNGSKLFYADRLAPKYFDLNTNTVSTWTPTAGSLPLDDYGNYAQLIATWRGRTVLSGVKFDAQNWFMSRAYDPLDFDYSPATTDAIQAVAGNNSDAGMVGDVITALIPYSDDVMVFGGDHMIHMMTGDPADNGQLDRVSDECGIAYGRAFCRMPNGALLFFGSRGGVYLMAPGGKPERITKGSIDERLSDIDMSASYVRMAWHDRVQGAHLFITPSDVLTSTYHYFWDARNDAWWIDQFANNYHNPISHCTIDGDSPDDRYVLIGSSDGYIRRLDVDATTDDGTNIVSNLFLGPFQNAQLNELLVSTASGSSNVTWSTHAGKDAQTAIAASAGATGTFVAGRNRSAWPKRFGHALYLKLASTGAWALEQMMGSFSEQGGNRWRKF